MMVIAVCYYYSTCCAACYWFSSETAYPYTIRVANKCLRADLSVVVLDWVNFMYSLLARDSDCKNFLVSTVCT